MRHTKIFKSTTTLFLLLIPLVIVSAASFAQELKIGVILPLTGQNSALGVYIKKGIELAESELSAEQRQHVKVFFEDDQWDVAKSVSAARSLILKDKVNTIFVCGSSVGMAIAPITDSNEVALIAIAASNVDVVKNRKYAFSHWLAPEAEARAVVKIVKEQGFKRFAMVTAEQEGMLSYYNALIAELTKSDLGDRLLLDEKYQMNATDFRTFLTKARAKDVDVIFTNLFAGAISAFAKQRRDLQMSAQLIGMEVFEDENEVKSADGALEGQWYGNISNPTSDFVEKFRAFFKEEAGFAAANGYDSFKLAFNGFVGRDRTVKGLVSYLKSVKDFNGAAGIYSATSDHRFDIPAQMKMISGGKFVTLP